MFTNANKVQIIVVTLDFGNLSINSQFLLFTLSTLHFYPRLQTCIGNIVHKTYSINPMWVAGWLLSEKNDWDIGSCLFVLVKQISANDFAEISKAGIY